MKRPIFSYGFHGIRRHDWVFHRAFWWEIRNYSPQIGSYKVFNKSNQSLNIESNQTLMFILDHSAVTSPQRSECVGWRGDRDRRATVQRSCGSQALGQWSHSLRRWELRESDGDVQPGAGTKHESTGLTLAGSLKTKRIRKERDSHYYRQKQEWTD